MPSRLAFATAALDCEYQYEACYGERVWMLRAHLQGVRLG